jgi:hypothetical protein
LGATIAGESFTVIQLTGIAIVLAALIAGQIVARRVTHARTRATLGVPLPR